MVFCCIQRLVPCSVVIRETSSSNKCEWVQRTKARHYKKRESNLEVLVQSFSLEIREPHRRWGRMIVGIGSVGGHQEIMALVILGKTMRDAL